MADREPGEVGEPRGSGTWRPACSRATLAPCPRTPPSSSSRSCSRCSATASSCGVGASPPSRAPSAATRRWSASPTSDSSSRPSTASSGPRTSCSRHPARRAGEGERRRRRRRLVDRQRGDPRRHRAHREARDHERRQAQAHDDPRRRRDVREARRRRGRSSRASTRSPSGYAAPADDSGFYPGRSRVRRTAHARGSAARRARTRARRDRPRSVEREAGARQRVDGLAARHHPVADDPLGTLTAALEHHARDERRRRRVVLVGVGERSVAGPRGGRVSPVSRCGRIDSAAVAHVDHERAPGRSTRATPARKRPVPSASR